MPDPINNTVAVAMSGGVDSSVVAGMLRARGEKESAEIERVGKELRELAGVEGLHGTERLGVR